MEIKFVLLDCNSSFHRYQLKYFLYYIRAAANAEKVSPTYIKSHCKVYDRKAIRETIVSQIQF